MKHYTQQCQLKITSIGSMNASSIPTTQIIPTRSQKKCLKHGVGHGTLHGANQYVAQKRRNKKNGKLQKVLRRQVPWHPRTTTNQYHAIGFPQVQHENKHTRIDHQDPRQTGHGQKENMFYSSWRSEPNRFMTPKILTEQVRTFTATNVLLKIHGKQQHLCSRKSTTCNGYE